MRSCAHRGGGSKGDLGVKPNYCGQQPKTVLKARRARSHMGRVRKTKRSRTGRPRQGYRWLNGLLRTVLALALLITALFCMILLDTINNCVVSTLVPNYRSRHYTILIVMCRYYTTLIFNSARTNVFDFKSSKNIEHL